MKHFHLSCGSKDLGIAEHHQEADDIAADYLRDHPFARVTARPCEEQACVRGAATPPLKSNAVRPPARILSEPVSS